MTPRRDPKIAAAGSLPARIAARQRRRMFRQFLEFARINAAHTVLDIGVSSDRTYPHSNYFESRYPFKDRITAVGGDDAAFLQDLYPGLRFIQADARNLPFADRSFDFVHSSAVLEHAGSREQQAALLREAWRVARKGIFMTTPSRWFPVEVHSVLPLVHWLPPAAFRGVLRLRGLKQLASEDHLNLLSASVLKRIAKHAGIENFRITSVAVAGWPSNLLLYARRTN